MNNVDVASLIAALSDSANAEDPRTFPRDKSAGNVLSHYGPDRLVIGKFCALATPTYHERANHRMNGMSTFPFPIMGEPWSIIST